MIVAPHNALTSHISKTHLPIVLLNELKLVNWNWIGDGQKSSQGKKSNFTWQSKVREWFQCMKKKNEVIRQSRKRILTSSLK